MDKNMNLWGGRFKDNESILMKEFNTSLNIDKELFEDDIKGSIVHVNMLSKCKIISKNERELIVNGLLDILSSIKSGRLKIQGDFEDIHTFVENKLIEKIGEPGKKLHTARSRNDQVATDLKLFTKRNSQKIIKCIEELISSLYIHKDKKYIMPGYTHLQKAQPVTFSYYMGAYAEMFKRDIMRFRNAIKNMNTCPLGSCALAGTTYNIDREFASWELGFKSPCNNFLDGVSDRDYIIELESAMSITMMHLSRLSEELILWSSMEFDFIKLSDKYSTGSSIMPQKKNPDSLELIRGKTGRVYGSLVSILTTMKGLPLAYNKDMQEDKEVFFDSIKTVLICLKVMSKVISSLEVKEFSMLKSVKSGFLNATDAADYLVLKGVPFRDAHKIIGEIVLYCEEKKSPIEDLSLEELKKFSENFENDIYEYIDYKLIFNKGIKKEMM